MRALLIIAATTLSILGLTIPAARAASLQSVGSFDEPIYVTSDPGDAGRLFVVERQGRIVQVQGGGTHVLADISAVVSCCSGERGLLSVALAPDFNSSGRLFVDYTGKEEPGEIHVAELVAEGETASSATLRNLLTIPHPGATNHYGGQLQFGPEGDLFVSTGDGGGSNDEFHNAQNLNSLLGKVLRIEPDKEGLLGYTVPADNPFVGAPGRDEIWSYGLRNPFRFSFDRGGSGIWIGDVGQSLREEIDHGPAAGLGAGANYGWNCFEGTLTGPATDEGCGGTEAGPFVAPVFEYPHADPGDGGAHGCAIIGGYVVRDPGLGGLDGRYLYGDLCTGELRSFNPTSPATSDRAEGLSVANLNSFGEDACGRLYTVSGNGPVSRLVGSQPTPCGETAAPLRSTYAGIKAFSRTVRRGKRALITVWTSPCGDRHGERIVLYRGRRKLGGRKLSRACTARFRPRIRHRSGFRARVAADAKFEAATSRRLTIKPRRFKRRSHSHHRRVQ